TITHTRKTKPRLGLMIDARSMPGFNCPPSRRETRILLSGVGPAKIQARSLNSSSTKAGPLQPDSLSLKTLKEIPTKLRHRAAPTFWLRTPAAPILFVTLPPDSY